MPAAAEGVFPPDTMRFLKQLANHNEKPWFEENRARYDAIKAATLEFVEEAGLVLRGISPTIVADPRPQGGSLMRIFRDVRFSKDKSPYRTHLGIGFHHRDMDMESGHSAPGYFLHVEPAATRFCAGMWRPDPQALASIRKGIVADPAGWRKAKGKLEMIGESLVRAPKGFDADHPLVDDLRRKDFIGCIAFTDAQVLAPSFMKEFAKAAKTMAPLDAWLAKATDNAW